MNPAIIAALASKSADVEAIVAIVGWANLFKIIPHALAIGEAIQNAPKMDTPGTHSGGAAGN
jgi:hypothetical protein